MCDVKGPVPMSPSKRRRNPSWRVPTRLVSTDFNILIRRKPTSRFEVFSGDKAIGTPLVFRQPRSLRCHL